MRQHTVGQYISFAKKDGSMDKTQNEAVILSYFYKHKSLKY
jgi:hypothetical protein